jgi:hypothetical protein
MNSKAKLKRLEDQRKSLNKLNNKKHKNHFGEGGSKST